MKKMTKREMFVAIKKAFEDGVFEVDADVVIPFCDNEISALDAKAAKARERAAAKRAESDELRDAVESVLTDEFRSIADITTDVAAINADATASKITYRLTQLVADGVAEKAQITIPATETSKARKVQGYKRCE